MAAAAPAATENPFRAASIGKSSPPKPAAAAGARRSSVTSSGGAARNCRIDCNVVAHVIRALSAVVCLGVGCSGGWAVYQASQLYVKRIAAATGFALTSDKYAIFLGLIGLYYCAFALLTFLAEVRTPPLRNTILRPFGFLLTWVGRGVLYILLGSIWVVVPIDLDYPIISPLTGGFWIGVGCAQVIIAALLIKVRGARTSIRRERRHRCERPPSRHTRASLHARTRRRAHSGRCRCRRNGWQPGRR